MHVFVDFLHNASHKGFTKVLLNRTFDEGTPNHCFNLDASECEEGAFEFVFSKLPVRDIHSKHSSEICSSSRWFHTRYTVGTMLPILHSSFLPPASPTSCVQSSERRTSFWDTQKHNSQKCGSKLNVQSSGLDGKRLLVPCPDFLRLLPFY